VVAGDALSEIAERLGTTVDELKRLNTLTSDEIKVGQKLVVATGLEGTVMAGGQAVSGATMTLWRTAGKESPESLAEVTTGENGGFKVRDFLARADGNVFYLTARGGAGDALALMSVLGSDLPDSVVVNELTTVASVFTHARFIDGTAISGNPLGLHIAAGNVPNLWTLAPAPGAR
jgi:murein DD-endopeptidase MepM/ murein hydrolase activator NlpD